MIVTCGVLFADKTTVAPRAESRPNQLEKNGHVRIYNYFWLRQRDDPTVLAYLSAENEYCQKMTAYTHDLENRHFEEIKGRIKQTACPSGCWAAASMSLGEY